MESEELLQCPYDKAHQILESRMQVHLGRCRRNHAAVPKVLCPFNVTHILNKPELEFHVRSCPDRKTFENFCNIDKAPTKAGKPPPVPEYQCPENWDEEPRVNTYNPREYVSEAPILRSLNGAKPSDRKKFRQEERLRLQACVQGI
ncbi:gametocyte-specific factor 1 homolog [Glossina fuscipes]|uniref:Gametocyte-specific factor 1 homolog n=1 Tax=Glossina fuscipes TaxID=7396 RepID=A0A8U0WC97_9MUSC|nr:gametocyte-specific factor 1 homolog [Glossina fuscipes]